MQEWLTEDLKQRVKQVFEPRFMRSLENKEVEAIAANIVSYMETIISFKYKINEKQKKSSQSA